MNATNEALILAEIEADFTNTDEIFGQLYVELDIENVMPMYLAVSEIDWTLSNRKVA